MDKHQRDNWKKIRKHFETLPAESRDNWFYKRAYLITEGKSDPLSHPDIDDEQKEKS